MQRLPPLVLLLMSSIGIAQPARPAPGSVDGHAISEEGGFPVRLATVSLVPISKYLSEEREKVRPSAPDRTFTDFDGYFLFPEVQPATYIVNVENDGSSRELALVLQQVNELPPARQRQLLSLFPQVTVRSGGTSRADVTVHRGAVIAGRLSCDTGGTLGATEVTATLISSPLFDPQLDGNAVNTIGYSQWVHSGDRGAFRFVGLPPGKYKIDARVWEYSLETMGSKIKPPASGELHVFPPGVWSQADARLIQVDNGDEISDADITVPLSKLHSVSGFIIRNGIPVESANVGIHSPQEKWDPRETHGGTLTLADGSYRLDLVPSGTYVVEAKQQEATRTSHRILGAGSVTVVVADGDVSGANIDLGAKTSTR